jgi:hypothetical protein
MRLFRSAKHGAHWFAFSLKIGWVIFPAEIGGWVKRHPARRTDLAEVHEVPLWLGFNTGIPGAPMLSKPAKQKAVSATGNVGVPAQYDYKPKFSGPNVLTGAAGVGPTAPEAL